MPKETVDNIDRQIGANLKNERKRRKLTLQAIAERAEVSLQQIQRYEDGVARITVSRLVRIAQALRRSPAFFLRGIQL